MMCYRIVFDEEISRDESQTIVNLFAAMLIRSSIDIIATF